MYKCIQCKCKYNVYVSVYVSVFASVYVSVYISVYVSVCISVYSVNVNNNNNNSNFFIYKLLTPLVNQGSKPTCPRE